MTQIFHIVNLPMSIRIYAQRLIIFFIYQWFTPRVYTSWLKFTKHPRCTKMIAIIHSLYASSLRDFALIFFLKEPLVPVTWQFHYHSSFLIPEFLHFWTTWYSVSNIYFCWWNICAKKIHFVIIGLVLQKKPLWTCLHHMKSFNLEEN